jgi:hypothetical protein
MTKAIHRRLERLEARTAIRGPVLFSWIYDTSKPVFAVSAGQRYAKMPDELHSDFVGRLTAGISHNQIAWIEQEYA